MTASGSISWRVVVVLDPNYGEQLRELMPGQAVWIVKSPINEPVVRALWSSDPVRGTTGITIFDGDERASPDEVFLEELETIDLHQGPYSTEASYTTLEVIGVGLSAAIRAALDELGFETFADTTAGFIADRSDEEARRLRT